MAVVALFWMLSSLSGWQMHPDHEPDRPAPAAAWHKIELYYQQIGTALHDEYGVTPQTLVASADIGAVGYFSGATIIDTVGLVTPALSKYYPNPPELIGRSELRHPAADDFGHPAGISGHNGSLRPSRFGAKRPVQTRQYQLIRQIFLPTFTAQACISISEPPSPEIG